MEHLFAVRVLVHYYDKPKVDHAAVRRLLSAAAVNHLPLLLSDGSTVSLSTFIDTPPSSRSLIADLVHPCSSSLVQVASVFMLAEARAAADAICTSPNELETACLALERLLGCLITSPSQLPVRDINLSARVKLGTSARRRAHHRLSYPLLSSQQQQQTSSYASILKAVNAVLRLCDVATHCLAVVSRQCISPPTTCHTAVNLSTRLLTLAAALHEALRIDASPSPALSFFSSNSLRTALVSGAMHLGAISIEHLNIDPMAWIHVANYVVTASVTSVPVPQRTSVMSALFGGMIKGGRSYESCERDVKAAERALLLLSTLHVALETDVSSVQGSGNNNSGQDHHHHHHHQSSTTSAAVATVSISSSPSPTPTPDSPTLVDITSPRHVSTTPSPKSPHTTAADPTSHSATISDAARSFLGERVVSAEEDGDEGRIAARTVYQACEEYAQRSGETEGVMGLLCRIFDAAGRQCRLEGAEETVVSLSDSILHLSCPPDESDASSDGTHTRLDSMPFHVDVFDQRMKDGFTPMAGMASSVDDSVESAERLKAHRQIGALALETLAHWVHRASVIQRYADIDMGLFATRICMSASLFTIGESSSSYDLRSAMSDFGLLLAPVIDQSFAKLSPDARTDKWKSLVTKLTQSCHTLNPILSNILNSTRNDGVVMSLLTSLLELEDEQPDMASDDFHGLPIESILQLVFKAISKDSALLILNQIVTHLSRKADADCYDVHLLNFRTACFTIVSFAVLSYLGIGDKVSHLVLQSLTGLYAADGDYALLVDFHQNINHLQSVVRQSYNPSHTIRHDARKLFNMLKQLPSIMRSTAFLSNVINNLSYGIRAQSVLPARGGVGGGGGGGGDSYTSKRPRAGFNLLWSLIMTHHALTAVEKASAMSFPPQQTSIANENDVLSSTSLFVQREDVSIPSVQLSQIFSAQPESPVTKMFIAETMSVLHFQSLFPGTACDILSLLITMIKNTTDILSVAMSEDWTSNLSKLHVAYRRGFSFDDSVSSKVAECRQPYISLSDGKGPLNLSGAELAMGYIQKLSCGKISEVLTHIIRTSTRLLDSLPPPQIQDGKHLIFDVLKTLPFIPDSFNDLSPQLFLFVSKYLRLAYPECAASPTDVIALVDLATRSCGLSGVLERAASSSAGILAFCKFACSVAIDNDIDVKALQACLHCENILTDSFGSISDWLRSSLPRVSLNGLLSTLLVSKEESAVTVSAYSLALGALNEACQNSSIWRFAVLQSLHALASGNEPQHFLDDMVDGPIIHSATLHDGVISLFETVLSPGDLKSDSQLCVSLLMKCLLAVNNLFERDALPSFECRSRLINFSVRLMLMSAVINLTDSPDVDAENTFEAHVLSIIFAQLKLAISALQRNGSDEAWRQTILTMCLLLDAFQSGLSDEHSSVFDLIDLPEDPQQALKKALKPSNTTDSSDSTNKDKDKDVIKDVDKDKDKDNDKDADTDTDTDTDKGKGKGKGKVKDEDKDKDKEKDKEKDKDKNQDKEDTPSASSTTGNRRTITSSPSSVSSSVSEPPSNFKLCTYTTTGEQYVEQHWYFCYTCDLAGSDGVCSVCARICHKGCELAYSKFGRFFCDCGHAGATGNDGSSIQTSPDDRSATNSNNQTSCTHKSRSSSAKARKPCICLKHPIPTDEPKPKPPPPPPVQAPPLPNPSLRFERQLEACAALQKRLCERLKQMRTKNSSETEERRFKAIDQTFDHKLKDEASVKCLLDAALFLIKDLEGCEFTTLTDCEWCSLEDAAAFLDARFDDPQFVKLPIASGKKFRSHKVIKSGAFDVLLSTDGSGSVKRKRGSRISFSPYNKVAAVAAPAGSLEFIDMTNPLLSMDTPGDKITAAMYNSTSTEFPQKHVSFHPDNPNIVLTYDDSHVAIFFREVEDHTWRYLEVEIGLTEFDGYDGRNDFISASWIEGQASLLLVTSEQFVKIFDVATDTFCPCFFAKVPEYDVAHSAKTASASSSSTKSQPNTIVSAGVICNPASGIAVRDLAVMLMRSDGAVFLVRTKTNEPTSLGLKFCFNVSSDVVVQQTGLSGIIQMSYLREQSILCVIFNDGSLLLLSLSVNFNKDSQADLLLGLRAAHLHKAVFPIGTSIEVEALPGPRLQLFCYQNSGSLNNCGILTVNSSHEVEVCLMSGNASSSVLGLAHFSASKIIGGPAQDGAFIFLNDGSIHRVYLPDAVIHSQSFGASTMADIVERRARRGQPVVEETADVNDTFRRIPDPIGFFEKSRIVSEHITVEAAGSDEDDGINYERMGVVLAGEGGDSMVSTRENQSLKFAISMVNKMQVLVGLRIRVGGLERSRNRVPAEIKVFGRLVRTLPNNGVKRWIDIPFTVPESVSSPQRILVELVPRRSSSESRSSCDGLVALDCVELHAISNEEFTERKLAYETERSKHAELVKQKREKMKKEMGQDPFAIISAHDTDHAQFNPEQAATLAVLNFAKREPGRLQNERGRILSEVNSFWSLTFENSSSQNPMFLQQLMRSSLEFMNASDNEVLEDNAQTSTNASKSTISLLSEGTLVVIEDEVIRAIYVGSFPSMSVLEKSLLSLSSLCRSLFRLGCVENLDPASWCQKFDKVMPPFEDVGTLLRQHLNVGRRGRQLYKSMKRACLSAVDITFFHCVRESNSQDGKTKLFVEILIDMLCGHDQYLRLATSQRLLELFDSLDGLTNFIGSPLEINGLSTEIDNSGTSSDSAQGNEPLDRTEDPDATQSWAYRCDSCGEVCDHEWWHCTVREDFDLCTDCLRATNAAQDSSDREDYILLRGTLEDESNEQSESNTPVDPSGLIAVVQRTVLNITDEVLNQMIKCTIEQKWRFLDAAETMVQLLGPGSPPELRELRLTSLFQSAFPSMIQKQVEIVITDLDASDDSSASGLISTNISSPGSAIALLLLLRILICSRGMTMPLHIHKHGIPALLVRLLSSLHQRLRSIISYVDRVHESSTEQWSCSIMDEVVWNEEIPDLSYQLSPLIGSSKPSKPFSLSFESLIDGVNGLESVLSLILEVLRVLEYSYRSASSFAITEEMEKIPRNILCDIINFCEVSASQATKSLLTMEVSTEATNFISTLSFDNTETFNDILDKNLYEEQVKRLRKIMSEDLSTNCVSFKPSVEIADILESLHKAAQRQPETWRSFAIKKEQVVLDIFQVSTLFDGEIQVHALQLLAVALSTSSELCPRIVLGLPIDDFDIVDHSAFKVDGGSDSSRPSQTDSAALKDCLTIAELLNTDCDHQADMENLFLTNNFEMLDFLISKIMLRSQNGTSRRAASHIIVFAILIASSCDEPSAILSAISKSLLGGLELMQFSGEIADGLMHCLRFFIACCQQNSFGSHSVTLLTNLTVKTMDLMKDRCSVLVSHPNARLYCRLSEMLDLSGYYLEADPCMACATAAWESSGLRDIRLDMVRAETKYTDCSIMHRLISSHEIHGVSVKVVDARRTRRPNRIDVYYSMRSVSDAADLKHPDHPWQKLKSLPLGPHRTEASVSLPVPVAIANIKLEFVEIHSFHVPPPPNTASDSQGQTNSTSSGSSRRSGSSRAGESLQCPRCSRSVTDRHGICRNCHENAYQCRQCRNINYENLDGFICNECGYCKHGRFEFSVSGRATHIAEPIQNEDDRKRASKIIEKETNSVHRCMEQLSRIRSSLIKSLVQGVPGEEPTQRSKIFANTRIGLADLLDSMSPRPEIAVIEALLEGQVGQELDEASQGGLGVNVTEEVLAEGSSTDAHERDHSHRSGSNIASPVNHSSRSETAQKISNESHGFNKTMVAIASTYSKECKTIFSTLSRGIRVLSITRAELVRYANRVGGNRLFDVSQESQGEESLATQYEHIEGSKGLVDNLKTSSCCYGCTQSFIANSLRILENILTHEGPCSGLIRSSTLAKSLILVCSLCEKLDIQSDVRNVITLMVNDNLPSTQLVSEELERKIGFCIDSFETVDAHSIARFEMAVLEATSILDDNCWEERLRLVIRILFRASKEALTCSSVAESIILPCLRVALRLTRSDSELTVIESRSAVDALPDGSASVTASREQADTSETDNDDVDSSGPVGQLIQESVDGDASVRLRTLQSNFVGMFGYDVNDTASTPVLNAGSSSGLRDITRSEERRSHRRQGSDLMASSRAPSSIGTAFDGHVSDEDLEVPQDRPELQVNINSVQSLIEKDHDGKRISANIGQWLEGRQTHASWVSDMGERSNDIEEKERSVTSSEGIFSSSPSLRSIFQNWKSIGKRRRENEAHQDPFTEMLSINNENWIVRLMLFTPCTAVRKEACALLELICGQEETIQLQLLDLLSGPSLQLSANVGEKSKEFFDLLESSLVSKNHRLYLIGNGFLPRLASLILAKAERLIQLEIEADASFRMVNFMEGYSLKRLVSLMRLALGVVPSKRPALREKILERENNRIVKCLQRAYLYVRKLISLKTRLTDECASQLGEVLLSKEFLFAGSTVTAIVSACVMELKSANRRNDAQGGAILLEELCQMLCPERKEPTCLLNLNKTPTQEEFMRGSMSRNPYSSTSFDGPLMRDVKNKICRDMDLPGLLEDDFGMELLVAGNVVKLDLPIMAVYEHVWRGSAAAQTASSQPTHLSRSLGLRRGPPGAASRGNISNTRVESSRGTLLSIRRLNTERDDSEDSSRSEVRSDPPMVVVYRLSGVDGEATEPIIDSLPVARDDEQSSEELYRDTVVLGLVGGFDVLFQLLAVVGSWGDDAETAVRAPALRLLRASCEVSQNRAMLAKSPNAVSTLLDCAASAFEHAQGSPAAVASAESLLIAAEQILAQQRRDMDKEPIVQQDAVSVTSQDPKEVTYRVEVFLGRLEKATSPTAEYSILHLLPFLIQGMKQAIEIVLEHLRFSWTDIDHASDDQQKLKQLGTVLFATPKDLRGNAFISETIRVGIAQKAVDYVISKFPLPKNDNSEKWDDALEDDGVPLVLNVLTGLSLFLDCVEGESGQLLTDIVKKKGDLILVLCQLEMAVSEKSVGTCAEELLEGMSRSSEIEQEINKERAAIKKARREAALASRAAILQESGLLAFGGESSGASSSTKVPSEKENTSEKTEKKDVSDSVFDMMDDLPDEVGPACVVCGDGFRCRPEEALTMYVFCKKIPMELSSKNSGSGGPAASGSRGRETGSTNNSIGRMDWEVWASGRSRLSGSSSSGNSSALSGSGNSGVVSGPAGGSSSNNTSSSRSSSSWCFTSVTHLNAIHIGCHREAARMDRTSRRDEWDGAALRNSQTRCNNLLPVRPPTTVMHGDEIQDKMVYSQAVSSYGSVVEGYFSRLSGVGRTNLTKSKIMMYDIGRSLLRFSDGGTAIFAEHSKGGGAHSNACLLPYMVQLGAYLMENGGNSSAGKGSIEPNILASAEANIVTQRAALLKYLDEDETGDLTFYLATSMILHDIHKWNECIVKFLARGLADANLSHVQVLRLIAFADLTNRAMKKGLVSDDNSDLLQQEKDTSPITTSQDIRWLWKLSRHLSIDESFTAEFGDLVNEQWEGYIRNVQSNEDFVQALERNRVVTGGQANQSKNNLDQIDLILRGNS